MPSFFKVQSLKTAIGIGFSESLVVKAPILRSSNNSTAAIDIATPVVKAPILRSSNNRSHNDYLLSQVVKAPILRSSNNQHLLVVAPS